MMDRIPRILCLMAAAAVPTYLAARSRNVGPNFEYPSPVLAGLIGLGSLYLFYVAVMGSWGIWNTAVGKDGRASTSKFQALLWTIAVLFSYVALLDARWLHGLNEVVPNIPPNLLVALGISAVTTTGAAAVTASNVDSGRQVKPRAQNLGLAPIFEGDDERPDLGKVQLMAFTLIAILVFLGMVFQEIAAIPGLAAMTPPVTPANSLPDIDASLMALMGLGSAVYLGGKLVTTTTTPFLSTLSLRALSVGGADTDRTLTINGVNLGASQAGNQILLDGTALQTPTSTWTDTSVTVVVPKTRPDGSAWTTGHAVEVRIISGGRTSNALTLPLDP
jgi:hypothetical protein